MTSESAIAERVVRFGAGAGLTGVVTRPQQSPRSALPALILLNAGILHHVGPFRMSVDVARAVASEAGLTVLRFDLSGLGDSPADAEAAKNPHDRAQNEIRAARDWLVDRLEAPGVIVGGLCTGACHAHTAALSIESVVGALMIDGFAWRTAGYYRRRVSRWLLDPRRWANSAIRLGSRLGRRLGRSANHEDEASSLLDREGFWDPPKPGKLAREVAEMAQNPSLALQFVYTDGSDEVNAACQFSEMFKLPELDNVSAAYFTGTHHTFPVPRIRHQLVALIVGWCKRHWPAHTGGRR